MALHERDVDKRKAACRAALQELARRLGATPSERDYKLHFQSLDSAPSPNQLRYIYGTWTEAVIDAGLTPLPTDPPRYEISDEELVEEYVRVANECGCMPPCETFRKMSRFSNRPYQTRWGKWSEVQKHFASMYPDRFTFTCATKETVEAKTRDTPLGLSLPMAFEPTNEFETIALFTLLANDLGYRILKIRAEFPDALLERGGTPITAEFEFLASNFVSHCHKRSPEILCICWRNDFDLAPVQTLCLEDEVMRRRKLLPECPQKRHQSRRD